MYHATPFISTSTPSDDFPTKDHGGDRLDGHWASCWWWPPTLPARSHWHRLGAAPVDDADNLVGDGHDRPGQPANRAVGQCRRGERAVRLRRAVGQGDAAGHRIVDISVANLQTAEQYSQTIAQQVIPVLRQEVLAAQGVRVNAISGATYTTEAYLYSVQSALTKLNF